MKSDSDKGKVVLSQSVAIDALPEVEAAHDLMPDENGAILVKPADEAETVAEPTAKDSESIDEPVVASEETTEGEKAESEPKVVNKDAKETPAKKKKDKKEAKDNIEPADKNEAELTNKKKWKPNKRLVAICGGSLLAFMVLWGVSGMVFAKTTVGDRSLSSSVSDDELVTTMEKFTKDYRLEISYPDGEKKKYELETLGISLNTKASVEATRKKQNSLKRWAAWWSPIEAQYVFYEKPETLREFITKEIDVSVQPSKDATLTIEKGTIKLTESVSGIRYSLKDPEQVIKNATHSLSKEPLKLEKLTQDPALSEELLKPYKDSLEKTLNQPIKFTIGDKIITPSTVDIANWLEITPDAKAKKLDITVNSGKVVEYINKIAASAIRPARSQVVLKKPDGSEQVIVTGVRGLDVMNKSDVATTISKTLLDNKGISTSLPVSYAPFKTISTGFYPKWIEADITNKRLYVHEYAETVKTVLISAGAPATPTVTGQYTVGRKVASQDMRGRNVDGSSYFQPRVPWVMYFYNDYAIHGNYWRPLSYFGNINSSHGCIGMTTADSAWLYNWAPAGTPVIVYK